MRTSTALCGAWLKWIYVLARANKLRPVTLQSTAFVILLLLAETSLADEFWATPLVSGKGADYLLVIDPAKPQQRPLRRLRCTTSLPLYIEEISSAASRVDAELLIRLQADVVDESDEQRAEDIKIKMICIAPKSAYPLFSEIDQWKQYPEVLPEEKSEDPFEGLPDEDCPFGEQPVRSER